jgi:signal transduction histidine kinase
LLPLKVKSQEKVKNIFVFFSLTSNLPAYKIFLDGFKSTFPESGDEPRNVIIECLDIGRLPNEEYARNIIGLHNSKYKNSEIDLIISIGPGTSLLLEKYNLDAILTAPVINIDFKLPGLSTSDKSENNNRLDIIVEFRLKNTLETSFKLFPLYKKVYIISGISKQDQFFTSEVKKITADFEPCYQFEFVSSISIDSVISFVKKIPPSSIVLVPSFLMDADNIPFSTPEALEIISNNCKAPVFPITDSFIGKAGGVGGYVLSYSFAGMEVGRISNEILYGKKINEINIDKNRFFKYMFDYRQLIRWGLFDSPVLPEESIFFNKEYSFFDEYKYYLLGITVFLLSQSFLIIYLFKLNRKQKRLSLQMMETENMHRELIREDRMATMTELTASISHELNQPLSAILLSAQAGKRFLESDKLDKVQAEQIFDNIVEDDKRAGAIISSVKNLMKLETREMESVELNSLVHETLNIISYDLIKKGIKIKTSLSTGPTFVYADKIQIMQVLLNLIGNSSKAVGKNPPDKKIVEICLDLLKGNVIVSVCDTGPGIDISVKDRLFKPFVTTGQGGTGIGLALCRTIIERHKGEIWAETIPGIGARFSFKLQSVNR